MSKRDRHGQHQGPRPAKRSRPSSQLKFKFGGDARQESELESQQINAPSSFAFSTRVPPLHGAIPSLATLCARVFVASFPSFSEDSQVWEPNDHWEAVAELLEMLPDVTLSKLFTMLQASCPGLLSHSLVTGVWLSLARHMHSHN